MLYKDIIDNIHLNNEQYSEEVERLKSIDLPVFMQIVFPYKFVDALQRLNVIISTDEEGDRYIMYSGKPLYFNQDWDDDSMIGEFKNLLCEQYMLSPHRYRPCPEGSVIMDVGSAEGNFSLINIDNAEYIYMFDELFWFDKSLKYTFKDQENVIFYAGLVGESNRLDDQKFPKPPTDIKIDVEGSEVEVLRSAESLIKTYKPRIQVCTYHYDRQFEDVVQLLMDFGYTNFSTSKRVMVYPNEWTPGDKFRRGVLFANY